MRNALAHVPPKQQALKNCFSPRLFRHQNAIERMFARLKDFRGIVARCERPASNFLAAVSLAATLYA